MAVFIIIDGQPTNLAEYMAAHGGHLPPGYPIPINIYEDETDDPIPPIVTPPDVPSTPPALPIADFIFTIYAGGLVGFINKSLGVVAVYSWQFGDGSYSPAPNVLHQYVGSGVFSVTLTVANLGGRTSKTLIVTIPADPIPDIVSFSFITGDLGVQFTDISTKAGPRNWDFGDGSTSTETNPYHTYASNGVYAATLTISGMTKTQQVVVDRGIRLDWQDNSDDETGFKVEHSLNEADWTQIAETAEGVNYLLVTFNIHGVDPSAVNYFRVRATSAGGDSGYTNTVMTQCL